MPLYIPTVYCSVASEILGREISAGGDSLQFKLELALLDGLSAYTDLINKLDEDIIELNRKLKVDLIRQQLISREKPTKKLDDYTLLFGNEHGPHKIKRFYPEYQSYGILEDTTKARDMDDFKNRLKAEMKKGSKVTEDELHTIYDLQLKFKKQADPYFPTIVGGIGMGICMYDTMWLEATALEQEFLEEYFMFRAEVGLQHIRWLSKQGFTWINGGGDLASNSGPIYSPATFNKIFVKPLKQIAEACNKCGMVYCYRTDGNIWSIFDDMFKIAGVQAFGEVDRHAAMTVQRIRERKPDLLILGNVSSSVLNKGTVEDVRAETRASLIESGGYNYIAGTSNAIVHGTPVENVFAMIDEIEKFKP